MIKYRGFNVQRTKDFGVHNQDSLDWQWWHSDIESDGCGFCDTLEDCEIEIDNWIEAYAEEYPWAVTWSGE